MRRRRTPGLTATRPIAFRAARRVAGGLTLAACLLAGAGLTMAAPPAEEIQSVTLQPTLVGTAGESRCPPRDPALGPGCLGGFDIDRDLRSQDGVWVVGYARNPHPQNLFKHVVQTVAVFDLAPLRDVPAQLKPSKAVLTYREVGRAVSPQAPGDVPSCITQLGVPADEWDGAFDRVVPARPAAVAGFQGAPPGDRVSWDVTPQTQQWLAGPGGAGALVLRGDDESMDVTEPAGSCLTYVSDLALAVELAPAP